MCIEGGITVAGEAIPLFSVGGVHEQPFLLTSTQTRSDFVRIQFRAGGLRYFSRVSAIELRDHVIAAERIFPADMIAGLATDLTRTGKVQDRVNALDRFFTALYSEPSQRDAAVLNFAEKLAVDAGDEFSSLFDGAPMGDRQLERLFAELIGFTPRKFAQLSRFERAEREVRSTTAVSLTDVALNTGYYDQPHFNRDFKRFVLISPGSYHFCVSPTDAEQGSTAEQR